jgi:hypothetical protein
MKSEFHYLDNYLLRNQIKEMQRDALETLAKLKMRMYRDSIAKAWSDGLDKRDLENAKTSYENEV